MDKGVDGARHMVHKQAQDSGQKDFKNQKKVQDFIAEYKPAIVI